MRAHTKGFRNAWPAKMLVGHKKSVVSLFLSRDGRQLLSGSADDTLRLWNMDTGVCSHVFEVHTRPITSVCLNIDGRRALSGGGTRSEDGQHSLNVMALWDVTTGMCLQVFKGHTDRVNAVCFSPDSQMALSGSADKTLRLWDANTGVCIHIFEGHDDGIKSLCFSADGRHILSASSDKTVRLWDAAKGACVRIFKGHDNSVAAACLSEDGQWVLSGYEAHPDGRSRTVYTGWNREEIGFEAKPLLWDTATGGQQPKFGEEGGSVCLSTDGRWALVRDSNYGMRLWDVTNDKCLHVFEGHTKPVTAVQLSRDGRWAVSGSDDHTIRAWELDWDIEAVDLADWDEGAAVYFRNFLALHPGVGEMPSDVGMPGNRKTTLSWTDDELQELIATLRCAGYGWLHPEGIHKNLLKITGENKNLLPSILNNEAVVLLRNKLEGCEKQAELRWREKLHLVRDILKVSSNLRGSCAGFSEKYPENIYLLFSNHFRAASGRHAYFLGIMHIASSEEENALSAL